MLVDKGKHLKHSVSLYAISYKVKFKSENVAIETKVKNNQLRLQKVYYLK